jgi:GNAT superfamily N-acetyltransferase
VVTPHVRTATLAEVERLGEVVATEFFLDPLSEWLVPDTSRRDDLLRGYFTHAIEIALGAGTVYVAGDFEGVAVWFDKSTPPPPPPADPEPEVVELCGDLAGNFHLIDELMYEAEPGEPAHDQLAFLVVEEKLRGQGIGSLLLDAHHARLDAAGLPAYLNATHPDSRRLYLRHGYHELAEAYHPPGGAPIWPMWRPPGAIAG